MINLIVFLTSEKLLNLFALKGEMCSRKKFGWATVCHQNAFIVEGGAKWLAVNVKEIVKRKFYSCFSKIVQ